MKNRKDEGFTLIELLIVIVILGILATVTVLAVNGITDESKEQVCETNQASLQTGVEAYYVQNDSTYPTAAQAPDVPTLATFLTPTYVRDVDVTHIGAGEAYDPATGEVDMDCANV